METYTNFFEERNNLDSNNFNNFLKGGANNYKIDGGFPIINCNTTESVDSNSSRQIKKELNNNKIKALLNSRRQKSPFVNPRMQEINKIENTGVDTKNLECIDAEIIIDTSVEGGDLSVSSIDLPNVLFCKIK